MNPAQNIPAELQALPQWVGWKTELRDGKKTKIPKNAKSGWNGSSTNPKTWTDSNTAFQTVEKFRFDGPGFVFSDKDPYSGLDIDDCRDPQSGEIAPWAWRIIRKADSYA